MPSLDSDLLRPIALELRHLRLVIAVHDLGGLTRAGTVAVHFDVDVIDFTDFPIANVPQLMPALPFDAAARCLKVFASGTKFGGLSISEINPDHMDEPVAIGARFNRAVAEALAGVEA
jgi:arginase family enzyme